MPNMLIPVDGSDNSLRAVQFALSHIADRTHAHIHLLNVQPAIISGNVRKFVNKAMIETYYKEEGEKALDAAAKLVEQAGVECSYYVECGHAGESIAKFARAHECEHIVMGTRGLGAISGLLLGSVATQVLHLVDVPVTLVK